MNENLFKNLYDELIKLWKNNTSLSSFVKLPENLNFKDLPPNYIKPAMKLSNWETNSEKNITIHNLIKELSPEISWKQTYSEEDVGKKFLENFCYFELIGPEGYFFSNEMSVYLIYFDKNTFYTWHNHEAEEIYFVLSGNAKFESIGDTPEILSSNQSRFHKSFQPHSLSTEKEMCLSLVVWRDKLSSEVSVVKI